MTITTEETPVPATDPPPPGPATAAPESARNRAEAISLFAIAFAAVSIVTAIFAVGIAARAVDRAEKGGGGVAAAPAAGETVSVTMTDFAFTPSDITVAAGGSIEFVNEAIQPHDFHVEDLSTPFIDGGDSFVLDVSSLEPGTYDVWCDIPGHKDAGMQGTLNIT